jgi:hypothetical protein
MIIQYYEQLFTLKICKVWQLWHSPKIKTVTKIFSSSTYLGSLDGPTINMISFTYTIMLQWVKSSPAPGSFPPFFANITLQMFGQLFWQFDKLIWIATSVLKVGLSMNGKWVEGMILDVNLYPVMHANIMSVFKTQLLATVTICTLFSLVLTQLYVIINIIITHAD